MPCSFLLITKKDDHHDDPDSNAVFIVITSVPPWSKCATQSSIIMGRESRNLITSVESSWPLTLGSSTRSSIPHFSRAWRTVDDCAIIISRLYQLDDSTSKGLLTADIVSNALTRDVAVKNLVDACTPGMNFSGIFRDKYRPRDRTSTISPLKLMHWSSLGGSTSHQHYSRSRRWRRCLWVARSTLIGWCKNLEHKFTRTTAANRNTSTTPDMAHMLSECFL